VRAIFPATGSRYPALLSDPIGGTKDSLADVGWAILETNDRISFVTKTS
jgi:hypothetical protein